MAEKHFSAVKRLDPLLQSVKRAPLDENFKTDIGLLVTESLVRAIEIRMTGNKQTAEPMRQQAVDDAMKQGYILTKYFYTALVSFEKDPAGLRTAYGDILGAIDLHRLHNLSFWDALVIRSAKQSGCTVLFSEDMQHARDIDGLQIVNPFH